MGWYIAYVGEGPGRSHINVDRASSCPAYSWLVDPARFLVALLSVDAALLVMGHRLDGFLVGVLEASIFIYRVELFLCELNESPIWSLGAYIKLTRDP